jgi:hypothetical protein
MIRRRSSISRKRNRGNLKKTRNLLLRLPLLLHLRLQHLMRRRKRRRKERRRKMIAKRESNSSNLVTRKSIRPLKNRLSSKRNRKLIRNKEQRL